MVILLLTMFNSSEDEYCNLRLENVVDIVGQEEVTKHYLKEVIK